MKNSHKKRLEEKGWKVGGIREFLGLSAEEEALIELKLALSREVEIQRKAKGLTQAEVAQQIGSSQSRVAKIEAGDPSVSVDLLLKTLLTLGAKKKDIGRKIAAA
jgi:DNA-binding XRE family transcriptional regulator